MGCVVVFSYSAWNALFPEFSTTVSEAQATVLFDIVASTLQRNDGGGPISKPTTQLNLMNYAVAHLAFLYNGTNTQPAAQVVGRINSATEGSVSVQTDYGANVSQAQAFWITTKYGAFWWQATNQYRRMRYIPGPCTNLYPGTPFVGPGWNQN
jgi:hypothetical protein